MLCFTSNILTFMITCTCYRRTMHTTFHTRANNFKHKFRITNVTNNITFLYYPYHFYRYFWGTYIAVLFSSKCLLKLVQQTNFLTLYAQSHQNLFKEMINVQLFKYSNRGCLRKHKLSKITITKTTTKIQSTLYYLILLTFKNIKRP